MPVVAANIPPPEQVHPVSKPPSVKTHDPSGFTRTSSNPEGAQPERRIPRDLKRWAETFGYPPIVGGSDRINNSTSEKDLSPFVRAWNPNFNEEEIKKHSKALLLEIETRGLSNEILAFAQATLAWWKEKHPDASLEDVLRHFGRLPDELIDQLKETYPEAFETKAP